MIESEVAHDASVPARAPAGSALLVPGWAVQPVYGRSRRIPDLGRTDRDRASDLLAPAGGLVRGQPVQPASTVAPRISRCLLGRDRLRRLRWCCRTGSDLAW